MNLTIKTDYLFKVNESNINFESYNNINYRYVDGLKYLPWYFEKFYKKINISDLIHADNILSTWIEKIKKDHTLWDKIWDVQDKTQHITKNNPTELEQLLKSTKNMTIEDFVEFMKDEEDSYNNQEDEYIEDIDKKSISNIDGYISKSENNKKIISMFLPSSTSPADQQQFTTQIISLDDYYNMICRMPNEMRLRNIDRKDIKHNSCYFIFNPLRLEETHTSKGVLKEKIKHLIKDETYTKENTYDSYNKIIYKYKIDKIKSTKEEDFTENISSFINEKRRFDDGKQLRNEEIDNLYNCINLDYKKHIQDMFQLQLDYHPKYAKKQLKTKFFVSREQKNKNKYSQPKFLQLDIDLKGDMLIDFVLGWNKELSFDDCRKEFIEYLKSLPEVVLIGTSSSGVGIRCIISYTTNMLNKNYDYLTIKKLGDNLYKDIHKTFSRLYIKKIIDKFGSHTKWLDAVYERYGQGTYPFGLDAGCNVDLYYNREYKTIIYNYDMIYNNVKKFDNKNTGIVVMDLSILPTLKLSLQNSIFSKNKNNQVYIQKSLITWIDENMNQYKIGTHNVILGLLAYINDEVIYDYFQDKIYKTYKKSHPNEEGGLSHIYKSKKEFINLCKKCMNDSLSSGFNILNLNTFMFDPRYLGLQKNKLL